MTEVTGRTKRDREHGSDGDPEARVSLGHPSEVSPAGRGAHRIQFSHVPWHALETGEVRKRLAIDPAAGLAADEVEARRNTYGSNALKEVRPPHWFTTLVRQLKSVVVLLLGAAAVLSLAIPDPETGERDSLEFVAILLVILVNTLIGFFTERKAQREMAALRKLTEVRCRVRRDGRTQEVAAQDVVPGDVLLVEAGDLVAADARLISVTNLGMVESSLTGESFPVDKQVDPIQEDTLLPERTTMIYKGTAVGGGRGEALVTATGLHTEIGRISSLVERAEEARTPLEQRLEALGHQLLWITLGIAVVVIITGVLRSREAWEMVMTGIALAVAAIPEGLPVVATIALARGMWRMARQQAIINHLAAVETLGSTTVICVDKTGTMTENRMTVVEVVLGDRVIRITGTGLDVAGEFLEDGSRVSLREDPHLEQALGVGVLCNRAQIHRTDQGAPDWEAVGDPLEVALLVAAAKGGLERSTAVARFPEEEEYPFSSATKVMATRHRANGKWLFAVKGAPESVLDACDRIFTRRGERSLAEPDREQVLKHNGLLGERGLRVIGLAVKQSEDPAEDPYERLVFLGLAAMEDPPRLGVRKAVMDCRSAGIRVAMVTGDQGATARSIAAQVGILDDGSEASILTGAELESISDEELDRRIEPVAVFSRVTPEHKLRIVESYERLGHVVAMTGDGVNDAPALKRAAIGVAMGIRGTQVAKEAADMVLQDDRMETIVTAVREGRVIFTNLRRFVVFLLSCNISEVFFVFLGSLVFPFVPLYPLQILFINLATDVFPALALGMEPAYKDVMQHPPHKPGEGVLTRAHFHFVYGYGFILTVAAMLALGIAWKLGMRKDEAITVGFLALSLGQLMHALNLSEAQIRRGPKSWQGHEAILASIAMCVVLILAAVYVPILSRALGTVHPGWTGWLLAIAASMSPFLGPHLGRPFRVFLGDER